MCIDLQVKYSLFLSNFTEMLPVSAESFHADRRTDRQAGMTKLIATLCNFADVPKSNDQNFDRMWKEVAVNFPKALSQYWTKLEEPSNPIHDTTALKKNGSRHSHE